MNIRHATPDDRPSVETLLVASMLDDGLSTEEAQEWLPKLLCEDLAATVIVLEDGKQLVGLCHASPDDEARLEIGHLYLDPTLRGKGLGVRFLAAASKQFLDVTPRVVAWIDAECCRLRSMFELAGFGVDEAWRSFPESGRAEIRVSRDA